MHAHCQISPDDCCLSSRLASVACYLGSNVGQRRAGPVLGDWFKGDRMRMVWFPESVKGLTCTDWAHNAHSVFFEQS